MVWMPAYNEEENIEFMVLALQRAGLDFVVCNGHSTDRTAEIARSMGATVINRNGHGKGYSVQDGLAYCTHHGYEGMVLIDCDRTYSVADIPALTALFVGHDMVVGSRDFSNMEAPRKWANWLMTAVLNLLFRTRVRDMASGLRVLRTGKFHGLITARSFDVEPQMYCVALGKKYRIAEVPVSYKERHGRSKVHIRHLFLVIWRMIAERLKYE